MLIPFPEIDKGRMMGAHDVTSEILVVCENGLFGAVQAIDLDNNEVKHWVPVGNGSFTLETMRCASIKLYLSEEGARRIARLEKKDEYRASVGDSKVFQGVQTDGCCNSA